MKKYGGWSDEGMDRFEDLCELVYKSRKLKIRQVFEVEFLEYMKSTKGNKRKTTPKWKSGSGKIRKTVIYDYDDSVVDHVVEVEV